jgi:hypothetical protein
VQSVARRLRGEAVASSGGVRDGRRRTMHIECIVRIRISVRVCWPRRLRGARNVRSHFGGIVQRICARLRL